MSTTTLADADADQSELLLAALLAEIEITQWRPVHKGALLGKVDVCCGNILELLDSPVLIGQDGQAWVGTPGRMMIGKDGKPIFGANGKPAYESTVAWRGRWTKARWSAAVLAQLNIQYGPNVLDGGRS